MSLQPTKTRTIDTDFYSEKDIAWISDLCVEYLHEKGVPNPCALGFRIEVEYIEVGEE